jgi:hypothetical protein
MPGWRRHFFYTTRSVKTTWKLRIGVLLVLILTGALTRGFLIAHIARSLVCEEALAPSDIIIVENFDPNYLVFKRAAELQRAGFASRALVPVGASGDPKIADPVSRGIAEVMAHQARLNAWDMIPVRAAEPISLNTARFIRDRVAEEHVRSVIVVAPAFRSRRSSLIYQTLLRDTGTHMYCAPVYGQLDPTRWTEKWHGIQEVTEESLKLQYYRLYVMPVLARRAG